MPITDKDVDKLKKVFATKDDLNKFKDKVSEKFDEVINHQRKFEEKVDERFDSVMTTLDKLAGRFETVIQETKITLGQYRRQEDKLEDHEKRISTLEVSRA